MCDRPSGSSDVVDGGGTALELTQKERMDRLNQFECERPSGPSHVVDGGGAAQGMNRMTLSEELNPGRGSRMLVESRPYLEDDCH
jgi:hypothetical protein